MNAKQRRTARRADQRRIAEYIAKQTAAGRIVPSEWYADGGSGYDQLAGLSVYAHIVVPKPGLTEYEKHQARNCEHYIDSWGTGNHLQVVRRSARSNAAFAGR